MPIWSAEKMSSPAVTAASAPGSGRPRWIPMLCSPSSRPWRMVRRLRRASSGNREYEMSSELPRADKPEDVGLSSERLQRLTDTLKSDIEKGIVPGAVGLIARRGKIAYETALGYRDREAGTAMEVDTIFRVASMPKPLTSLSAMMLAEEGKLLTANAVAHFIPEFSKLTVAIDSDNASAKTLMTEPCQRQMTVQDLLRHTSGFTYAHLT